MARLGFCGLGQMGAAMTARLLNGGHEVVVWNRTPAKAEPLVALGATAAATPAEAATGTEAVLTMLADPGALDDVVFGTDGLHSGPVNTLVEMSTVGPDAVRRVAQGLGEAVTVIDAPVLGSIRQVREGTLKIFVGGPEEAFARWQPVLAALGTPSHIGPLGSGAAMKLVANLTLGGLMTTLGEALSLAAGLGVDQANVLDVLVASPIGVTATGKRPLIESGNYRPNFRLALAVKDLDLIEAAAQAAGVELRVTEAARAWYHEALDAGLGELDYSAVIARIGGRSAAP